MIRLNQASRLFPPAVTSPPTLTLTSATARLGPVDRAGTPFERPYTDSLVAESAQSPDPRELSDDPIVRWEPPEDDPDDSFAVESLPSFVPGVRPVVSPEAVIENPGEPGADTTWEYQPVKEAPPPAPKGQWWAGWLPDPRGRHEFRYWDGSQWTDHVADSGLAGVDPV